MALKNSIKAFKVFLGNKESVLDTQYRRVADMIELHWGYKEFFIYINKLLIVEKDVNRQGFPLEALEEIYVLQEIHEKIFPGMKQQSQNETTMNTYNNTKPNAMRL